MSPPAYPRPSSRITRGSYLKSKTTMSLTYTSCVTGVSAPTPTEHSRPVNTSQRSFGLSSWMAAMRLIACHAVGPEVLGEVEGFMARMTTALSMT